jgi:N,N'-diacetyllegionaminate synthase
MPEIKIKDRKIGNNHLPFIIAETGINHNGNLERAFQMITVAKESGADAVKFQTFKAEEFISDHSQMFTYFSKGEKITESMFEMFKRYEFSIDSWFRIKEFCDKNKIIFLSTPQNSTDLDLLIKIGIPAIKVGSDDFTNLPLLKDYASTHLPMIVSCGMADLAEVYQALETIGTLNGYPTVLLLCTSQYPTPSKDVNLLKLRTLANAFPMAVMGFSDHTQGTLASSLALAFGARCFEKHFTLNHEDPGPDHWFSEEPEGLKVWVNDIHKANEMLGSPIVKPTKNEKKMQRLARRSVVVIKDVEKGERLTLENIGLKRPGKGLKPVMLNQIVECKASRNLKKDALIELKDFY